MSPEISPKAETKTEILKELLDKFNKLEDIIGSIILARNGLVICSSMPMRINEKAIAAISAAMVESGKIASEELFAGKLRRVTIESEDGMLISIEFKEGIIFAAFVKERANVGLVLSQMKKTARDILKVIG